MVGTTRYGYSYPDPTDPVTDGANRAKAAATEVDTWLGKRWGGQANLVFAASASASLAVTFPAGFFPVTPYMLITQASNAGDFTLSCAVTSPTAATIRAATRNATAVSLTLPVFWFAFLP